MEKLTQWLLSGAGIGWLLALVLSAVLVRMFTRNRKSKIVRKNIFEGLTLPAESVTPETPKQPDKAVVQSVPQVEVQRPVNTAPPPPSIKSYDTYLIYNSDDELEVKSIYEYLVEARLRVWFDLESVKPGDDWLDAMQDGIAHSKTCLVFNRGEPGVWQKEETKEAIRKKTAKNSTFKIIPVLLPGGEDFDPTLPPFLTGTAWVDLRKGLLNVGALKKLIEAIRGGDLVPIHPVPEEPLANDELPTGYKADVNRIISLLVGEALYSRRDVSIRELIQNSVDACERRGNTRFGASARAEIIVNINSTEGYFEVIDNGDGMSPEYLSDYFAVIGRSIREEENILDRVHEDEKTRAHLIGQFGIGFISTYILAKKIVISTTHEGSAQINLEINGISEPFIYRDSSKVDRGANETGTTVRIYLKQSFLPGGRFPLDVQAAVEEFCRHVQFITVIKDDERVSLKDNWNTDQIEVIEVVQAPLKFELHLGVSNSNLDFFASNAGFLISKTPRAISPKFMPRNIGGEINFYPGIVDLNMARDTIIENEKAAKIRSQVSKAIKNLLIKTAANSSEKLRAELTKILIAYLDLALKNEKSKPTESVDESEGPPLSSIEAAELLMDVWMVKLADEKLPLREALGVLKRSGKSMVYMSYYYDENKQIFKLIEESLKNRGFLLMPTVAGDIEFKSGEKVWYYGSNALEYLSKRYYFDLFNVGKSPSEGIDNFLVSTDVISPKVKNVLDDIERSTGNKIRLSKLSGAPVVFELNGQSYLNVSSELFDQLANSSEHRDDSTLKTYLLGLLRYQMS